MDKVAPTVLIFQPQAWDELYKFTRLHHPTHTFKPVDQRALNGIKAHFGKALRFHNLAEQLAPRIEEDHKQLETRGFSPAENAKVVATFIEAAILELYSSIDCTAKVMRAVYGNGSRSYPESTRKVFQNADKISGTFPEKFKTLIREASWYPRLLHLRDELTHLDTGIVRLRKSDHAIEYIHFGMKNGDESLTIKNAFPWLKSTESSIKAFIKEIFHHLNGGLLDTPVQEICGLVDGRFLVRYINPSEQLSFNSGSCVSWVWFDTPGEPRCPFLEHCGAYSRKANPESSEA